MVSLVFFDILQLPDTVISSSEKLTHPNVQSLRHCNFTDKIDTGTLFYTTKASRSYTRQYFLFNFTKRKMHF